MIFSPRIIFLTHNPTSLQISFPCAAWFWGDPHFQTLDGLTYTFNGLGEYTLARADITGMGEFRAQGRTVLVTNSTATQFTAFAFGIQDIDYVEV